MPQGPQPLTISQVNKAGKLLRHHICGEQVLDAAQYDAALDVVRAFRAAHSRPLVTANNTLRGMVRRAGCRVEVSQRLKRMNTILDKLANCESTLALSRMQDIGGVRAVLPTVQTIRVIQGRLEGTGRVRNVSDYIVSPRSSGYRGVHVIVEYAGRAIEVQLRTQAMHQWALAVEGVSTSGTNYKQDGSTHVHRILAALSDMMNAEAEGTTLPLDQLSTMFQLFGEKPGE